ncbi:FecR family protein [Chitinophaga sp. CF118]|uniref:FecR family protein n=1 Tax=Chitinophaga sp. CF118 TaxID=1884367 RepID=UPI0008E815F3|nr:FecR domain-containing protein [Chitinophaga sp. CF118]SFE55350.1 FecR family protein [Chitinophaga sp. CF118]
MNHEHIYQLLLQKRNGTISVPDDEYVTGLINVHEDIELMWKAIKHSPSIQGEEKFWHEMNTDLAWQQVEEKLLPRRKAMWWTNRWLIAAVITGVVATGITFMWQSGIFKPKQPQELATTVKAETELQLKLANGQTVKLPYHQAKQQISAGDVQLNAGSNKLQYTANKTESGFNTLIVPPKMDYKLVLSDGTEVWLNATTKLRFPFNFNGNQREVYLEGEAFFNVAKNTTQPFIVHTEKTEIRVLGTTFNVSAYKNGITSTSLVSGAVTSKSATAQVTLKPGQEAVVTDNDKFDIRNFDSDEVLAWMRGIYIFHNTSLKDIGGVIERWYGVKVVFDRPELAAKKFTGGLEKLHTLDYFLETLKIVGNVDYSYDKEGVLHLK